ncbi:uncharacterized protein LOC119738760 [Patiria miniata]|uniref:VCBS repeat-containing protein n=1 Tax=Patiria miniata TaxID=46514 RepID=A0A914B154_PATMI|nr:uncharacterized protein LOC119738760 [Patiria miniata]
MMSRVYLFFVLLYMYGCEAWQLRQIATVDIPYAAMSAVLVDPSTGLYDVVVSSFSSTPFSTDYVYVIRDVAGQIQAGNGLMTEVLTDELKWPNEVGKVPEKVLGRDDIWWGTSGFLVPTKTHGVIALIDAGIMVPATTYDISSRLLDPTDWFYHRVEWADMNKDGRIDAVTSRAYLDSNGQAVAEMVWFEQPRFGNPLYGTWSEHVMYPGPDALTRFGRLTVSDGRELEVIISAQYFTEKLVVSWVEGPTSSWDDPSSIQHRVISDVVNERYFDIQLVDLNIDGNVDLLVSVNSNQNGKLLAYEIPRDFRTGAWRRHLIVEGFIPNVDVITEGHGSPGSAFAFYPGPPGQRIKPLILLTGDDDSNVYILESTIDNDPSVWSYTMTSVFYAEGTVGSPAIQDIDGDGFPELFIPAWTQGTLSVYTFKDI